MCVCVCVCVCVCACVCVQSIVFARERHAYSPHTSTMGKL